jgi:hypothetical protein
LKSVLYLGLFAGQGETFSLLVGVSLWGRELAVSVVVGSWEGGDRALDVIFALDIADFWSRVRLLDAEGLCNGEGGDLGSVVVVFLQWVGLYDSLFLGKRLVLGLGTDLEFLVLPAFLN